jgi:hypothetical protein
MPENDRQMQITYFQMFTNPRAAAFSIELRPLARRRNQYRRSVLGDESGAGSHDQRATATVAAHGDEWTPAL